MRTTEYEETADSLIRKNSALGIKLAQILADTGLKVYLLSPDSFDNDLALE